MTPTDSGSADNFANADIPSSDIHSSDISGSGIRAAVEKLLPSIRTDLERLARIPSVSVPAFDQNHVQASAELTATLIRDAGIEDVKIVSVPGGAPAVIARQPGPPGSPTVLLYAHHDVQPPGNDELWDSPPFEPTERDGRLYGRGAADDKAGIAAHLAAIRAYDGKPPVGVTLFVEGEEEIGSPTLENFLATYQDELTADVIVLADSQNWAVGTPALTTSLRGLVDCYVTVSTLKDSTHSGMYGGAAPDSLTAMCRLVASLHDDDGRIAIDGLGAGLPVADLDLSEDRFRAEAGVLDGVNLIGEGSLPSRLWGQPSVSVLAIDCPPTTKASNTLHASARAKLSMRVPPGIDAEAAYLALTEHVRTHAPWGARVEIERGEVGQPYAIDATGPRYDAARAAFAEAWGTEPVQIGIGGTIPFIAAFAEAFPEAAILVTGVEDPDSRAHGPNESLHLGEFATVCLAETLLLDKLSQL